MSQKAFEDVITKLALEYLDEFVRSGGSSALKQLLGDDGSSSPTEENRVRESIEADRAEIERLVGCLTPDLVSVLGPRITKLKARTVEGEARLADLKKLRVSERQARKWTKSVAQQAGSLAALMRSGTTAQF